MGSHGQLLSKLSKDLFPGKERDISFWVCTFNADMLRSHSILKQQLQ